MALGGRGNRHALDGSVSFFGSGLLHGLLLAWVAFGTVSGPAEKKQNIYDMTIRGQEKRIIWYRLRDKLPEVRPPASAKAEPRPLRALKKFDQTIVAGSKDNARTPRMVWTPAPEPAPPKPQPLPNVIAVEQKPLVKPFIPPAPKPVAPAAPALPAAPELTAKLKAAEAGPGLTPLVKQFVPPSAKVTNRTAALPDAPEVSAALKPAEAGPGLRPLVKSFTPPRPAAARGGAPALPVPPDVAGHELALQAQLAIVGLDPAKGVDLPAPPPPSTGGFSAGPKPAPNGAATENGTAEIAIPGLTVRGGARDAQPTLVPKLGPPSMRTLLAGVRAAPSMGAPIPPRAAHVSSAPDPVLDGRVVYSIAIQMPNVTSYSGSWIVWFAEHEQMPGATGDVRPPVPLRKVDPKYVASAAADGVEGIVRLAAVIRRNGRVDSVRLLKHLDDRLDASAMESLGKWEFAPGERNGAPLDVDAVFEIPFRLAPKLSK